MRRQFHLANETDDFNYEKRTKCILKLLLNRDKFIKGLLILEPECQDNSLLPIFARRKTKGVRLVPLPCSIVSGKLIFFHFSPKARVTLNKNMHLGEPKFRSYLPHSGP